MSVLALSRCVSLLGAALLTQLATAAPTDKLVAQGEASWYGEAHRGKLMANGRKFDPQKLTAASWFYPLGTRVQVTSKVLNGPRTVVVTITDRGPARYLVSQGRIIDLSEAAFRQLDLPVRGLIPVRLEIAR